MLEVLSSEKCKELDKIAINKILIPGIVLMENAAQKLFEEVNLLGNSFLVVCGKGNNGGDGLALARKLIIAGKKVKVIIISKDNNFTDDFKINYDILNNIINNSDIVFIKEEQEVYDVIKGSKCDIVVDAIFGVGLNKDISGMYKTLIEVINKEFSNIISVDVPSGIDCNSGGVRGIAIRASKTYTFETVKRGFLNYKSFEYLGELKVLPIGIPKKVKEEASQSIYILERDDYRNLICERKIYGHKGNYGRAIIVAGSFGMTGAAFITTECTVRSGAGLTTLICRPEIQNIMSEKLIEAMTISKDDIKVNKIIEAADSIAIGPGLDTDEQSEKLLEQVIVKSTCPLIIDADAIKILARRKDLFEYTKGRAVLTPHPGEMSVLTEKSVKDIEQNRIEISREIAEKYNVIILLKGYNTVITNGKCTYINRTGNSKMASGGMGDALTGIINGLASQKMDLLNAALLGAYVHGIIADQLGKENYIINARDIIQNLPKYLNEIIN